MKSFLLVVILLASAGLCVACQAEPPGKGATAEIGYRFANPIAAKLETFYQQQGKYPFAILEVMPDFDKQKPKEIDFGYTQLDNGRAYDMFFAYRGPGMNICHFASSEQEWRCSGAY